MSSLITVKLTGYQLMLLRDIAADERDALEDLDCSEWQEEENIANNIAHLEEIIDTIDKALQQ